MSSSRKFRIFSCDGGGFKGYLTSLILDKVEEELNIEVSDGQTKSDPRRKLGDYFDMYVGTSTGALIACGLAFGLETRKIRKIYEDAGEQIFPDLNIFKEVRYRIAQLLSSFTPKKLREMTSLHRFWLSKPLFDGTELKAAIENVFGKDTSFGDIAKNKKRVIVTAYDCWNSLPFIFDSYKKDHASLKIVDILLASSAYPGGFPSYSIPNLNNLIATPGCSSPDGGFPFVDGGLVANNPALLALSEYWEHRKRHPQIPSAVIVASFGTGKLILKFDTAQSRGMGQLDWTFPFGDPLLEVIFGGYSKLTDKIASSLVKNFINKDDEVDNYFRFQPYIHTKETSPTSQSPCYTDSLDSVFITFNERKMFESASFQYSSKSALERIADQYLATKQTDQYLAEDFIHLDNPNLQVSQRIKKLVTNISESLVDQLIK